MPVPAHPAARAFPVSVKGVAVHSGRVLLRAAEAVSEFWPLIARLEARTAAGRADLRR